MWGLTTGKRKSGKHRWIFRPTAENGKIRGLFGCANKSFEKTVNVELAWSKSLGRDQLDEKNDKRILAESRPVRGGSTN